ncbi:recombinase family protein [Ornithinibacillus sp. JPR2-1]|uniref:recombinase family protein n=1 Tax=Ornithinibacillus sp. JPR2-1 TaxID=2094019 RepID=UPI0031D303F5
MTIFSHPNSYVGGLTMVNNNKIIAIYIRVSTHEQAKEGYSIAAQKERLTAYCKAQGWDDYKFYIDEGVSAKDTNRPELNKLFEDMRDGKINMILVYRLDRFTRRVIDLHKMLEEMKKYNCAFKSATEIYDTSSAMGRMFITIVAALAQWEAENLSERIKMALEEKVSSGERVGGIPYGFDLDENEKLVKNEKAKIVLDMVEKIKSGMSATAVADFLSKTNKDKPVWRASAVLRILQNPALYGATRWNDKVYENTHEGIISKEEYLKLQTILKDRSKHHRREIKSIHLFQGVLACPSCGRYLSVNRFINKRKDGSQYQGAVYRCQPCEKEGTFNKRIGENHFLKALYRFMEDVELEQIEQLEPTNNQNKDEPIFIQQLREIERKREKYQRAWASDLMTDDEFSRLMEETRRPYEELKRKAEEYTPATPLDMEEIKDVVINFNTNFKILTQEEKKTFIAMFFRKIHFEIHPQPPLRPDKHKKGKDLIVITKIDFY